ncbi:MAG: HU family DNA-binding protein [Deltaproteobacteria bacterium]|nr:HU family DNA-binding protein [Deltaproteobacteria bacterium]
MTKADLIACIAKDCRTSKATAERVLNATLNQLGKCMKRKDKITLTGFGTFYVAKRRARKGRNPQTGAEINIKAAHVAKFKPGKQLKDWVA